MNENLDLTKILANVPKGTELWHTVFGEVEFNRISNNIEEDKPYLVFFTIRESDCLDSVTTDGRMYEKYDGECVLFPSKDQRDWSKFKAPNKKVKVTLHPFDKVLVRFDKDHNWEATLITGFDDTDKDLPYLYLDKWNKSCIPYNKDTAHLLGTSDECPIDYEIEFSKEFKED